MGHNLDGLYIPSLDDHFHFSYCQFEPERRRTEDTKGGTEAIVCVAWIQGGGHGGGHRGGGHHGGVYPGGQLDGYGGHEKGGPEQHADWRQASYETCFNHPTVPYNVDRDANRWEETSSTKTQNCFEFI